MDFTILCQDLFEGEIVGYLEIEDCVNLERVCRRFIGVVGWCKEIRIDAKKVGDDDIVDIREGGGRIERCRSLEIKNGNLLSGIGLIKMRFDANKLIELNLIKTRNIMDKDIVNMKGLRILKLPRCAGITDEGIKDMKGLRVLDLCLAMSVSDEGIKDKVEMEDLRLFFNLKVTMRGIEDMTRLRILMMAYNRFVIENEVRRKLSSVERLYLRN